MDRDIAFSSPAHDSNNSMPSSPSWLANPTLSVAASTQPVAQDETLNQRKTMSGRASGSSEPSYHGIQRMLLATEGGLPVASIVALLVMLVLLQIMRSRSSGGRAGLPDLTRECIAALPVRTAEDLEYLSDMLGGYHFLFPSLPMGSSVVVRLEGRVSVPHDQLLIAPLSGKPCALYSAVALEVGGQKPQAQPIAMCSSSVDFWLEIPGTSCPYSGACLWHGCELVRHLCWPLSQTSRSSRSTPVVQSLAVFAGRQR